MRQFVSRVLAWSSKLVVAVCLITAAVVINTSVAAALPAGFSQTQIIGSGLDGASGFEFAPDGRIFILERTGAVKVYKNGQLLAQPFYTFPSVAEGDRGLIGIAFDPDFATNKYVYFYYTGTDLFNHLVRFSAASDVATAQPYELYRTTVPSNQLHVGGSIRFDTAGKLFFAVGDNGYPPNAQDLSVPYGKILRINKDGSVPGDNPFAGQAGKLPEIWAYGLRNPWRFQFDSATGQMYGGDVGNDSWEEVNHIEKGKNYGWPTAEGICNANCNGLTNPIYTYNHDGQSSAVTGGPVYRATQFPAAYQGKYFFADYARSFMRVADFAPDGALTNVVDFERWAGSTVDLKVGTDGSLYYVTYYPARLYKISYEGNNQVPAAVASADKLKGQQPLTVNFSSAGSYDPDGQPLNYSWDFGDGTTSTAANPQKTYTQVGTYTVTLTVNDGTHSNQAVPVVIQVGIPPTLTIGAPADDSRYNAGDTIHYTAHAVDGAGLDINDGDIKTDVIFHHATHIHPFIDDLVGRTNTFVLPDNGETASDTWYEIKVTATDTNGLATSKSVFIRPNTTQLTLNSSVVGIPLTLDGQPRATPHTVTGVVNFKREISAPATFTLGTVAYVFDRWSDGGARTHQITTPNTPTTYTAYFKVDDASGPGISFEDLHADGQPVGIQGSHWGANVTAMTLGDDAFEGVRSGRIEMGQYISGDARWYMEPQTVIPGHQYTYRHWYKSSLETKVVADILKFDGSHEYVWLGLQPASATWKEVSAVLTMPANAAKVTISQYLSGNGWLNIDGFRLKDGAEEPLPPVSENLFTNANIETLAPDTTAPSDWTRGSWGANTTAYSWEGVGRNSGRGLKVELSNYQNGNAKWISKAVPVEAASYTFTNWHQGTATSNIVADVTLADGSHSYMWLGQVAATAAWTQTSISVTLPLNATSVKFEQYIDANGWLATDDYSLLKQ